MRRRFVLIGVPLAILLAAALLGFVTWQTGHTVLEAIGTGLGPVTLFVGGCAVNYSVKRRPRDDGHPATE